MNKQNTSVALLPQLAIFSLSMIVLGFINGILTYIVGRLIIDAYLYYSKGLRRVANGFDLFHIIYPIDRMYGCILLEKVQSIDSIKKYFMSADKKYFQLKSRVTKVLGSYYYKPMEGEELEAAIEKAYIEIDEGIRSE
jgi:hypothetical protein